jgi:hypothetical protein
MRIKIAYQPNQMKPQKLCMDGSYVNFSYKMYKKAFNLKRVAFNVMIKKEESTKDQVDG